MKPNFFKGKGAVLTESLKEHKNLSIKSVEELRELAESKNLEVKDGSSKIELINALSKLKGE